MNTATTLTYQCPNCSAGLVFHPDKGRLCCEFCLSEFTEEELLELEAAWADKEAKSATEEAASATEEIDEEYCAEMSEYDCASCGAQILCDDTTAATSCPYCHNPVILAGRLSGQMKPHKIIPFRFSREEAQRKFLAFAGKKRFVPRDFIAPEQLERITGIYYPFWVTDADTNAIMTARATRVRSWRVGDYRYTETSKFRIRRAGDIHFEDIVTPAITEEDRDMLDGILPYPSDSPEDFSMPRLQGFLAKKRDIEKDSVREAVKVRMMQYTATLLRNTIHGYATVTPNEPRLLVQGMHWSYTLMPIFLLTYRRRGKLYPFAMNGYTGKVYGRFPASGKRVALCSVLCGLLAGIAAGLLRYFLF